MNNPKRRANPSAGVGTVPSSSHAVHTQKDEGEGQPDIRILSPKSPNSRTSPDKQKPGNSSFLYRPTSPLKPSSPLRARVAVTSQIQSPQQQTPGSVRKNQSQQATWRMPAAIASPTKPISSPVLARHAAPGGREPETNPSFSSTSSTTGGSAARSTRSGAGSRKLTAAAPASSTTAGKKVPSGQSSSSNNKKPTAAASRKVTATAAATPLNAEPQTATGRRTLRKRVV